MKLFSCNTYIHRGTHCYRIFWKPEIYICSKRDQINSCKNSPCQLFWMEPLDQEVHKLSEAGWIPQGKITELIAYASALP